MKTFWTNERNLISNSSDERQYSILGKCNATIE